MINKFFKKEAPFLGFLGMGGGIARGGGGGPFEATGGSVSTISDGGQTYKLHTFNAAPNAPQPFLMTAPGITVEFFLVGGGGAGSGGGGGGGGILTGNFDSFAGDVAVKVGNGRAHPGATNSNIGGNPLGAEDSYLQHPQFTSHPQYVSNAPNCLAAAGGGGGGAWGNAGGSGGSGGGAGQRGSNPGGGGNVFGATSTFSGATHPSHLGADGGLCAGPPVSDRGGGGGGAAPDAGSPGPPSGNREGGDGYTSTFSGSPVTYGGGGGGGGRVPGGSGGNGGPGGGGNSNGDDGNPSNPGQPGTDGLGGGGGAAGYGPHGYGVGGRGGNGIVMIRYLVQ